MIRPAAELLIPGHSASANCMNASGTLLQPAQIGSREVKNRLAKTATAETRGTPDGFVTDEYVNWYRRFAEGGVGLIHTGIVYATRDAKASPHEVGLDRDDKIPGFRALAEAVHRHGCLILAQLHHPGRQLIPIPGVSDGAEVVAPSPVRHLVTRAKPRELSADEIQVLVSSWAEAARRAQEAGLDGVQIHAAHGYLIHSFLAMRTNRRRDAYGGSFAARTKIVEDLVSAIRSKTGREFLITVKLSGQDGPFWGGLTPRRAARVAEAIAKLEIDAIEVSSGSYEYPRTTLGKSPLPTMLTEGLGRYLPPHMVKLALGINPLIEVAWRYREGFNMTAARKMKPRIDKPLICLGGFKTPAVMAGIVERGEGDLISMGRQLIADPDLPNKLRSGEPIRECSFCNSCIALVGVRPTNCYRERDPSGSLPPLEGAVR